MRPRCMWNFRKYFEVNIDKSSEALEENHITEKIEQVQYEEIEKNEIKIVAYISEERLKNSFAIALKFLWFSFSFNLSF